MKDILLDIITHTHQLGFIDLVKVTGSDTETVVNGIAEDRTVIVSAKLKLAHPQFIGVVGLPNLGKLKTILGFDDYNDTSEIKMMYQTREGAEIPSSINFATASGDFVNNYRLMTREIVEDKVKSVKFAGATWNVDFAPKVANIQRFKKQASANSEETTFVVKTSGSDLKVYFGDVASHSGNFVFESDITGSLAKGWAWPVKQFLAIMDLQGDKRLFISDQGAMRITVDTGLADYQFLMPAQTK